MSNVDAPNVNADGEITNEELLVEQSGIPAMTKKFTIETDTQILGDLDVTGTVTATSFIGDGSQLTGISGGGGPQSELVSGESFVKFDVADPHGDSAAPANPKLLSTGGVDLWDVEINTLNDFIVDVGDDIGLTAGDDVDISAAENVNITSVDYMDIISEDNIYLTAEGKIDLETSDYIELDGDTYIKTGHPLRLQDDFDGVNPGMESFVQDLDGATSTEVPSAAAVKSVTDDIQSQIDNLGTGGGLDSAEVISTINDEFKISSSKVEIGQLANASGASSVAIGNNAAATQTDMVVIGSGASGAANNSVIVGHDATSSGPWAVVIGDQAEGIGTETVAIGNNTVGGSGRGVAIGDGANTASGTVEAIAVGNDAVGANSYAIAIGGDANASGLRSIAIGNNVTAITDDAVTIGSSVAGRLTYDTTNDWTFGAGVTMTDLTASGATVVFSNLPTTDPLNAGQLWNDLGTLKISAG
jgi:hypothetical protein